MDRANLLDALSKVERGSLPQPSDNAPDAVPKALLALAAAADEEAAWRACRNLLHATCNPYAQTYYPVVVFVVPILADFIERGAKWPSYIALHILSELYLAYDAEPGFDVFFDSNGAGHEVASAVDEAIAGLKPLIERISADPRAEAERRAVARELFLAMP